MAKSKKKKEEQIILTWEDIVNGFGRAFTHNVEINEFKLGKRGEDEAERRVIKAKMVVDGKLEYILHFDDTGFIILDGSFESTYMSRLHPFLDALTPMVAENFDNLLQQLREGEA